MKTILAASIALAATVLLAGCGGGRSAATATPNSTVATTTQSSADRLSASARKALEQNYRLSVFVLWHNSIPAWAEQSTRGPALASLRSAAANRRARGVRIKTISNRRTITSFKLGPSYTSATAIVLARERVQPSNSKGRSLGRTITLKERGRFTLHRLGGHQRFVVWKVVQLH